MDAWQEMILRAMLELGEFTVADVARVSGANSSTIRTVLRRNDHLVERVGVLGEDRPGGRWVRYRVCPEAASNIASEPPAEAPESILAALALLLEEVPDTREPAARALLLRRAQNFLEDGRQELANCASPTEPVQLELGSILLRLAQAESGATPEDATAVWRETKERVQALQPALNAAQDRFLATDVAARLNTSSAAPAPVAVSARLMLKLGQPQSPATSEDAASRRRTIEAWVREQLPVSGALADRSIAADVDARLTASSAAPAPDVELLREMTVVIKSWSDRCVWADARGIAPRPASEIPPAFRIVEKAWKRHSDPIYGHLGMHNRLPEEWLSWPTPGISRSGRRSGSRGGGFSSGSSR